MFEHVLCHRHLAGTQHEQDGERWRVERSEDEEAAGTEAEEVRKAWLGLLPEGTK